MSTPIISFTAEMIRRHLSYDPSTGIFTRRIGNRQWKVDQVSGCLEPDGYIRITIGQMANRAHRLAWLYTYGEFPKGDIDHINGNRSDNRISNLREVTRAANCQNRRVSKKGTGFLGVSKTLSGKKFKARISKTIDGKLVNFYLGYFDTPQEAYAAYLAKKRQIHEGCTI